MILVSVGTQLPFDRMVGAVDRWAGQAGRRDVLAQIGIGAQRPAHIDWVEQIEPPRFREHVAAADLLVTHAGTGSVFMASEFRKPIIIMPRKSELGEHRNDHQMATARRFAQLANVTVAFDENDLLDHLHHLDRIPAGLSLGDAASPALIEAIRNFIDT